MKERYVHTIWCDDIRPEVGNKPSLMGVYTAMMVIPATPATLSKLGVVSWVCTPLDRPFEKLSLRVVRDDGTVLVEIPETAIMDSPPDPNKPADGTRRTSIFGFVLGPVEVPVNCKYFQVLATCDSEELPGPKLFIIVDPNLVAQSQATLRPSVDVRESPQD